jgi:hypothetical protein
LAGVEFIDENGGGPRLRLRKGVEFIAENGGGPRARLRKHQRPKQPK